MLKIKIYPDPVLRKKCQEIAEVNEEIKKLAQEMLKTMYAHRGAGLAAPQVGILKRLIVVDIGQGPEIYINPKILKKRGKTISVEGCLSLPNVSLNIKRAFKIKIEALKIKKKKITVKAKGLKSFALQHVIDHLNGVQILDINVYISFSPRVFCQPGFMLAKLVHKFF